MTNQDEQEGRQEGRQNETEGRQDGHSDQQQRGRNRTQKEAE